MVMSGNDRDDNICPCAPDHRCGSERHGFECQVWLSSESIFGRVDVLRPLLRRKERQNYLEGMLREFPKDQ
jgi:hypothetical protein